MSLARDVAVRLPESGVTGSAEPNLRILRQHSFERAKDSSGRPIQNLWKRNGIYYCQLSIPGKGCRRFPLRDRQKQPIRTLAEAEEAMWELKREKRMGDLPAAQRVPAFDDYVEEYLKVISDTEAKKPKTIVQERSVLKGWVRHLGAIKLNRITLKEIDAYIRKRKQARVRNHPIGNRTVNVDVLVLSNLLKFAKRERYLTSKLPTEGWEPLPYRAPKRRLFTKEDFGKIREGAMLKNKEGNPKYRNGQMLADAIHFMMFSGARVTSALATRWSDVNFELGQVALRKAKYSKTNIVVDFNSNLEALLKEMHTRRAPGSDFLFPGTRTEENVNSLRKTFELVRGEAGLRDLHFHDTRHYFISMCVMSGIDFMTIARWVGHSDGGILIGKVYGHLSNEHAQQAARKVCFDTAAKQSEPVPTQKNDASQPLAELLKAVQQGKLAELLKAVQQATGEDGRSF